MPIYAYRCAACGHSRDVLQKLSDPTLSTCPSCGASQFQKQLTAAGFQLKGSGWYATDFRGGTPAPATGSGDSKPAEPSKTESASSTPSTSSGACGTSCACH